MKEHNYNIFRGILANREQWGDEVMRLLWNHAGELGLNKEVFDNVYETFWDLYCKKSGIPELTPKRIDSLIQRVKL